MARPSVQGNPGTAATGNRSPRSINNVKNQFYAVHGRGMSIQSSGGNAVVDHNS